MTLYRFNLLSENVQYQAVWDLATHIDTTDDKGKLPHKFGNLAFFNTNDIEIDFSSFQ